MINDDEETRTFVLRYKKVLSNLKRKLQSLMQIKKGFIEEENDGHVSEEEEDESNGLLDSMQIQVQFKDIILIILKSYEDYLQQRDQRIKGIHKDLGIVHSIINEMKNMAGMQSNDIDLIINDVEKVEANTEYIFILKS